LEIIQVNIKDAIYLSPYDYFLSADTFYQHRYSMSFNINVLIKNIENYTCTGWVY